MFNIDLLNSAGLQKIIARVNQNVNNEKQKISFTKNDSKSKIEEEPKYINSKTENSQNKQKSSSFLSYFIFSFFVLVIFLCLFIDYYNYYKNYHLNLKQLSN